MTKLQALRWQAASSFYHQPHQLRRADFDVTHVSFLAFLLLNFVFEQASSQTFLRAYIERPTLTLSLNLRFYISCLKL